MLGWSVGERECRQRCHGGLRWRKLYGPRPHPVLGARLPGLRCVGVGMDLPCLGRSYRANLLAPVPSCVGPLACLAPGGSWEKLWARLRWCARVHTVRSSRAARAGSGD